MATIVRVVLILMLASLISANDRLKAEVEKWAGELSKSLFGFAEGVTAYNEVKKAYDDSKDFVVEDLNGTKIMETFGQSFEQLLHIKTDALRRVERAVENSQKNYTYDAALTYNYRKVKYVSTDNQTLVIYPTFSTSIKINTSNSYVHVPTNIYENDPTVLNSARMTESLDSVFTSNYKQDPALLWQYYCDASTGAMRSYPGKKWKTDSQGRDLYDCRQRNWFILGSSSPKDLVIVIDKSGTMIGNNFGIARVAALILIDTLQENDFFNVLSFNTDVEYAFSHKDCKVGLMQATKENKEAAKVAVNNFKNPSKTGDVTPAMEVALKLLRNARGNPQKTGGCNQAIAFFSDEVEGDYAGKNAFEKLNKDKHVRVFSYLVGRKKDAPKKAMVKMSCDNRGYFYQIETVGNIWDNALKYINVLSRPLALAPDNNVPIYTPLYLDASGLGMMMTISMPVFKKTNDPKDASLLGVTGTDIAVSTLEEQVPKWIIGSNGYGFVINANGFFLMHPLLKSQEGYLPSPANVYLEDLERCSTNASVELKIAMINTTGGHKKFILNAVSENGKRFTEIDMNYFYSSLNSLPFSAAIAIPNYDMKKLKAKALSSMQKSAGLEALRANDSTKVFIAPWPYCNITAAAQSQQELSKKAYPTVEEIRKQLLKPDGENVCDQRLVNDLLLSAQLTTNITSKMWKLQNGVNSIFIGTSAGYSRTLYTDIVPITRDLFKNEYYSHGVNYVSTHNESAVFSVPLKGKNVAPFVQLKPDGNVSETHVTVSLPVKDKNGLIVSVLGMNMRHVIMREMLMNATVGNGGTSCSDNTTFDCYLVDENGYIVASNGREDDVGNFLGVLQGRLTETLYNQTHIIFKQFQQFEDTQAECTNEATSSSDATRILSPFFTISAYLIWWTQTFLSFLSQFTLYSSVSPSLKAEALASVNVSCTKKMVFYVLQDNKLPHVGHVQCRKDCKRDYAVSKVAKTNLALIAFADKLKCGTICKEPKVSTEPVKKPTKSKCPVEARYRKPLQSCFSSNATEDTSQCGSGMSIKVSVFLVSMALLLSFAHLN